MVRGPGWTIAVIVASAACSPVYVAHAPGTAAAPPLESPAPRGGSTHRSVAEGKRSELAGVLGTLIWPLAVDRSSVLSSPYGARAHRGGAARFHEGLDLRAPDGTPVYAVADGRVARSGEGGAYGNVIVVEHAAGLASLYGHNRENLVREGDRVRRGEVIAVVGHTGNATGDHLHFELRWRGGTVDPRAALPRLGGASGR